MFFRALGLVLASIALMSCSEFTSEQRPLAGQSKQILVKDKELEGLKNLPSYLSRFIKDELPPREVPIPFQLLDRALEKLATMVHCSEVKEVCTAQEMQHFFNSYFLKENQISNEFLLQVMKVKTAIVGGSATVLSKEEIGKFQDFLKLVHSQANLLIGSMKVLTFQSSPQAADARVLSQVTSKLQEVSKNIMKATSLVGSTYEFSDAKDFIFELGRFLNDQKQLEKINKWLPVVEMVKNFFFGPPRSISSEITWERSRQWIFELYGWCLQIFYQLSDFDLNKAYFWRAVFPIVESGIKLIEQSPAMVIEGGLRLEYLDQLIDEIKSKNIFRLPFSAQLAKETVKKFILYWIEGKGGTATSINELVYFKLEHLNVIKDEYTVWKAAQQFLVDAIDEKSSISVKELQKKARDFKVKKVQFGFKQPNQNENSEIISQGFQDWLDLLTREYPLVLNPEFRSVLTGRVLSQKVSIASLSIMNAVRGLTRLVFRGYGVAGADSRKLMDYTISEERLMTLENNFKAFGVAVSFLDPRVESSAKRAFKEANFFTFSGDGNHQLSAVEFYELVNMMISAGLTMADQMFADFEKRHCIEGTEIDVFDHRFLKQSCFASVFESRYREYFKHMPKMITYLSSLSFEDRSDFAQTLLKVSEIEDDGRLEYGELRLFSGIGQYVEAVTTIFDQDRDGRFSSDELQMAFPRFKAFIEEIAYKESWVAAQMPERIFLYLIHYGQKPDGWDLLVGYPFYSNNDVTRTNIVKTLGILRKSASQ